jgi:branched-chain amino acid transport system substrate-binding protein
MRKSLTVALLFCLLGVAASAQIKGQANELQIAILAPLSGAVPSFGASARNGALLAIDQWNARGGVLGMNIRPIIEDSQCSAGPAIDAANKVVNEDKVHYIVGEVCSSASIPVSMIANAARVIQISPTSTNTRVTVDDDGIVKPYIFRACFVDPFQGKMAALFAFSRLNARTAFLMLDERNGYVKGLSDTFEEEFQRLGGVIVGKSTHSGMDTDFTSTLDEIKRSSPDLVYLPDYYNVVSLVARQAKARGLIMPFLGGDGWDSSDLDMKATEGGYFTNHYSPEDASPEVRDFLEAYGTMYKDTSGRPVVPDAIAALAYDATNVLLQAISLADGDDTDAVRAALETNAFDSLAGRLTFDAQHNPLRSAMIIHITRGRAVFDSRIGP